MLVLDGYEHLHAYKDQRGHKDVILGKVAVVNEPDNRMSLRSESLSPAASH